MAGPFITLRKPNGSPLLAWGGDQLRVNAAARAGFQAIVLTAEGLQDPQHRLEAQGLRVLRCGYLDSPDLAQAQRAVERCAPIAAEWVRAGIPTLVLCAAGENRSALMTARIRWLVTGDSGAVITASMRAVPRLCHASTGAYQAPPGRPCTFSNGVFRRWVERWPATAPLAADQADSGIPPQVRVGLGVAFGLAAVGLVWWTLQLGRAPKAAVANRRRRRRQLPLAA